MFSGLGSAPPRLGIDIHSVHCGCRLLSKPVVIADGRMGPRLAPSSDVPLLARKSQMMASMTLSPTQQLSLVLVGIAGIYLVVLGLFALAMPARTAKFLLGFASTQRLHFIELLVRVALGATFIGASPHF